MSTIDLECTLMELVSEALRKDCRGRGLMELFPVLSVQTKSASLLTIQLFTMFNQGGIGSPGHFQFRCQNYFL